MSNYEQAEFNKFKSNYAKAIDMSVYERFGGISSPNFNDTIESILQSLVYCCFGKCTNGFQKITINKQILEPTEIHSPHDNDEAAERLANKFIYNNNGKTIILQEALTNYVRKIISNEMQLETSNIKYDELFSFSEEVISKIVQLLFTNSEDVLNQFEQTNNINTSMSTNLAGKLSDTYKSNEDFISLFNQVLSRYLLAIPLKIYIEKIYNNEDNCSHQNIINIDNKSIYNLYNIKSSIWYDTTYPEFNISDSLLQQLVYNLSLNTNNILNTYPDTYALSLFETAKQCFTSKLYIEAVNICKFIITNFKQDKSNQSSIPYNKEPITNATQTVIKKERLYDTVIKETKNMHNTNLRLLIIGSIATCFLIVIIAYTYSLSFNTKHRKVFDETLSMRHGSEMFKVLSG